MSRTFRGILILAALAMAVSSASAFPTLQTSETTSSDWFFLGDFHTYDYASKVDFFSRHNDGIFGGYWIGTDDDYYDHLSWQHTLPGDLSVPPDVVTRAKLWIDAAYVNDDGNTVEIEGILNWDPLNDNFLDNSLYNLATVNAPGFWNDGAIDVTAWAGERCLRIDAAVLMMDYRNGDGSEPGAAVPEPATIFLVGAGLAGVFIRRRRK